MGMTPCWLWTGKLSSEGYPVLCVDGQKLYVHRLAARVQHGDIPSGYTVDHLCRNRACIRPTHMDVVTRRVNVLRGIGPAAVHARATHCPQGHEYNKANTYWWRTPTGEGRRCRVCQRERKRLRRAA
jgi:hypothetical protein